MRSRIGKISNHHSINDEIQTAATMIFLLIMFFKILILIASLFVLNTSKVFITDNKKRLLSTNIRFRLRVPRVDNLLSPLLLTIPLQLLAYHVALLKNCDIDKPRNLAKSVTVE